MVAENLKVGLCTCPESGFGGRVGWQGKKTSCPWTQAYLAKTGTRTEGMSNSQTARRG